jgi:hypothetical protein
MSRFDVLRSLMRSAARAAGEQLGRIDIPAPLRGALDDALKRRVALTDRQLTGAAVRVAGVREVTVAARDGALHVDAVREDGSDLSASLAPVSAVFAPAGAKDVCFRVRPAAAAGDGCLRDIAATISGELARAVWGPFLLGGTGEADPAFAERDGDLLRIDLRTVPAVRRALGMRAAALAIDALTVKAIAVEEGALRVTLGLHGVR